VRFYWKLDLSDICRSGMTGFKSDFRCFGMMEGLIMLSTVGLNLGTKLRRDELFVIDEMEW
jgi:hypothetical protein